MNFLGRGDAVSASSPHLQDEAICKEAPQGMTPCGAYTRNVWTWIGPILRPHADQILCGPVGFTILTAESNPNAANASTTPVSTFRNEKRDCPPA